MGDVEDRTQVDLNGGDEADADVTDDTVAGDDTGDAEEGDQGKFDVSEILDEYGLESPEALKEFIANMQENGVIPTDDNGLINYGEGLEEVADDARLVLSVEKRQAIQQVTMLGA